MQSQLSITMEKRARAPFKYLFQNPADPLCGSVLVVLGVAGQQLENPLAAIWQPGKHVGEGATTVDGKVELPLSLSHCEERENQACNHKRHGMQTEHWSK